MGDEKSIVLAKLEKLRVFIVPEPYEKLYFDDSSEVSLHRLSSSEGVLIWLEHNPMPLRIEFSGDKVVRTWPKFQVNPYANANYQRLDATLSELQRQIETGMLKQVVFELISEFGKLHQLAVGNFVVGWQEFSENPKLIGTQPFRELLLRNDAWSFEGLKDLVWYKPYYSQVTLYFKDGRLERIEHYKFPFDLP